MPAGTHVTGLREVVKALQETGVEVDDLKEAMGAIAAEAAEIAAAHVRSASGRLAASVRGNKAKGKAVVTAGRASVPYAGAINYGWPKRGIKPRKFMQAADAEIGPKAVELLEKNINHILTEKGLT